MIAVQYKFPDGRLSPPMIPSRFPDAGEAFEIDGQRWRWLDRPWQRRQPTYRTAHNGTIAIITMDVEPAQEPVVFRAVEPADVHRVPVGNSI